MIGKGYRLLYSRTGWLPCSGVTIVSYRNTLLRLSHALPFEQLSAIRLRRWALPLVLRTVLHHSSPPVSSLVGRMACIDRS